MDTLVWTKERRVWHSREPCLLSVYDESSDDENEGRRVGRGNRGRDDNDDIREVEGDEDEDEGKYGETDEEVWTGISDATTELKRKSDTVG